MSRPAHRSADESIRTENRTVNNATSRLELTNRSSSGKLESQLYTDDMESQHNEMSWHQTGDQPTNYLTEDSKNLQTSYPLIIFTS